LSVSPAKTVHTTIFFLLRSHAVTVERSVRFNTLDPGFEVLTWFGTYIYLPQFSGFSASKALR